MAPKSILLAVFLIAWPVASAEARTNCRIYLKRFQKAMSRAARSDRYEDTKSAQRQLRLYQECENRRELEAIRRPPKKAPRKKARRPPPPPRKKPAAAKTPAPRRAPSKNAFQARSRSGGECQAWVRIQPDWAIPGSDGTMYRFRVDVITDTKKATIVSYRLMHAIPGKKGTESTGEEARTMFVKRGKKTEWGEIYAQTKAGRIRLWPERVLCALE